MRLSGVEEGGGRVMGKGHSKLQAASDHTWHKTGNSSMSLRGTVGYAPDHTGPVTPSANAHRAV